MTLRWPIASGPDGPTIGPPQLLDWSQTFDSFSSSRDGRVLALATYDGGGLVFDPDHSAASHKVLPHRDARGIAVSPDGRWVITVSHTYGTMKLWNAQTGELKRTFPEYPRHSPRVMFSLDGRWLAAVIPDLGCDLIETETWTSTLRLKSTSGVCAFSPDSMILAVEANPGSILLFDVATGRELAEVADADGAKAGVLLFSPDGSHFFTSLLSEPLLRIWDLRTIRQRLAEFGLDWGSPPAPQSAAPEPPPRLERSPPPMQVDLGELPMWMKLAPVKTLEASIAEAEAILSRQKDQPEVREWLARCCNDLAWLLVARRESSRDPRQAVNLARRAVAQQPNDDVFLNTLGLALFRAGEHSEAISVLERSLALSNDLSVPYDLLILAMCHSRSAQSAKAQECFDRALSWMKMHPKLSSTEDAELKALKSEAEAMLRASAGKLPENVFASE